MTNIGSIFIYKHVSLFFVWENGFSQHSYLENGIYVVLTTNVISIVIFYFPFEEEYEE